LDTLPLIYSELDIMASLGLVREVNQRFV